ncbi:MAG: flagellar hook-length control protein FliK [Desulfobacterales bacterium]|nr:flagellar hook-length control protein FliK [Desulfobacterales bacterium]
MIRMSGIKKILFSSSDITFNKEDSLRNIKAGQTVDAKVAKILSDGKAILIIDGKKLIAKTHVPLLEGESINLLKGESSDLFKLIDAKEENPLNEIYLKVLKSQSKSGLINSLLNLFEDVKASPNKDADTSKLNLNDIGKFLQSISLKSDNSDLGFFKNFIQKSGLSWENKVFKYIESNIDFKNENINKLIDEDLKAIILKFVAENPDSKETNLIKNFANYLEDLQILNKHTIDESGRFFLPIPFLDNDILKFGQLLIDLSKEEKEKNGGEAKGRLIRISLLLEMSSLGNIRADFSILKKALTGAFGVADKETQKFVRKNLGELKRKLNEQEIEVYGIDCILISPEKLTNDALLKEIIETKEGMLNIVI